MEAAPNFVLQRLEKGLSKGALGQFFSAVTQQGGLHSPLSIQFCVNRCLCLYRMAKPHLVVEITHWSSGSSVSGIIHWCLDHLSISEIIQ